MHVSQEARYQLCRACQVHLLFQHKEQEECTFDLQRDLASAMLFFIGGGQESVNAEVYVHDATTTDLNVPRHSFIIGRPDTLLVPIFRFYCYQNGCFAALLPDVPTTCPQQPQFMPSSGCVRRETTDVHRATKPVSNESDTSIARLQEILQRFCDSRGAKVQISAVDARRLQEARSDRDAEGICLHTLLQAGLAFADSGMHHARRLADQFRSFLNCCTQGAGQTLAAASASTKNQASNHLPPTLPVQREEACSEEDSNLLAGKLNDEAGKSNRIQNDADDKQRRKRKDCAAAVKKGTSKISTRVKQAGTEKGKQQQLRQELNSSRVRKLDMPAPLRRVRQKTAPGILKEDTVFGGMPAEGVKSQAMESDGGDIYILRLWKPSQGNQDPRAAFDAALQQAAALLSDKPTVPERFGRVGNPDTAYDLPDFHCAFRTCKYECATQQALAEHIINHHTES
eukprot:s6340_g2.t1